MSWGSFISGIFGGMGGEGASTTSSDSSGWGEWGRMLGGALQGQAEAELSEDQLRLKGEIEERLARVSGEENRALAAYQARLNDWTIDREKDKKRAGTSNYKQFGNLQGYTPVSTPTPVANTPPVPASIEELLKGPTNG